MSEPDPLPKALSETLEALPDPDFADRVRKICVVAAKAIGRLRDIDLMKYERYVATGTPDLSLWEEVAPVIRDTVMDVNAVLSAAREHFPPSSDSVSQAIEDALGAEFDTKSQAEHRRREVVNRIRQISAALASDVTNLGERVRRPEVVADRWNLLTDVQEFRGRFRRAIGDLVFSMLTPFTLSPRNAIIPWYAEEVMQAVALRRAVVDLARVMGSFASRARSCRDPEVGPLTQELALDLDRFGKFKAYALLRAQDKQHIVEFRHYLERARQSPVPDVERDNIDEFAKFAGSLVRINERDILLSHDRESMAQIAVRLELIEKQVESDLSGAITALDEVEMLAQGLYGRDGRLDDFLRRLAKRAAAPTAATDVRKEMKALRMLLSDMGAF